MKGSSAGGACRRVPGPLSAKLTGTRAAPPPRPRDPPRRPPAVFSTVQKDLFKDSLPRRTGRLAGRGAITGVGPAGAKPLRAGRGSRSRLGDVAVPGGARRGRSIASDRTAQPVGLLDHRLRPPLGLGSSRRMPAEPRDDGEGLRISGPASSGGPSRPGSRRARAQFAAAEPTTRMRSPPPARGCRVRRAGW